jgi:UDP-N-acetylglucosamine 3-dehydrogenase
LAVCLDEQAGSRRGEIIEEYPGIAKKMIRLAISGVGAIAERAHIPAFVGIQEIAIVALQSRTLEKAERVAAAMQSGEKPRVYRDYDEMLRRERPDAVGIFTPNALHCDYTVKAIAAGAHVLVEKPMAPTVAEARTMMAGAKAASRVLMVAMQRRFGILERTMKRAIDQGAIGTLHFFRSRLSHGGPELWAPGQNWFFERADSGGGAMLDLGVHVADLARWFLGEVESVSGQVATLGKNIGVEDNGAALLKFRTGAVGIIEASWTSRPPLSATEIYGSEGRIMAGYPGLDIAVLKHDGSTVAGFERDEIMKGVNPRDWLAPSRELARTFVAAIEGGTPASPDDEDGMRAIEIIEACYRSSRSGSVIELPLA